MTPPNAKPIGYLIVLPKETRDRIIAWFDQQTGGMPKYEMPHEEHGLVQILHSPDMGFPIDCRYRTKEEALAFTTNVSLFGLARSDPGDRIEKYLIEFMSNDTLASINPEWLNAPWSVEMVFVPQEEKPLEKFLAEDRGYEGRVVWLNQQQ